MAIKSPHKFNSNLEIYLNLKTIEKNYFDSLEAHEIKLRYSKIQKKIDEEMILMNLLKKIKKIVKCQDKKLIRKAFPSGPKRDPLPFKKKFLEKLRKSLNEGPIQMLTQKKDPIPIQKKLSFELNPVFSVNNSPKKLISRQFLMLE